MKQEMGKPERLMSIDALRGLVMVVMALDHARDFFSATAVQFDPTDLARTTPLLFLTRWVTHFCAPVFVFLAGLGAALSLDRGRDRKELARFLVVRGLWLVLLEVLVVSPLGWSFRLDFAFTRLQVIWVIGISMVLLGGMVLVARPRAIGVMGVAMIVLHNLGDGVKTGWWAALHQMAFFKVSDGVVMASLYPLIPWLGVMMAGYAAAEIFRMEAAARRSVLGWSGVGLTVGFVVLRASNWYGDPAGWAWQGSGVGTLMSFLKVNKYPPSLLYVLMTLGPALGWLALAEERRGKVMRWLSVFGQTPLVYYLLHLPLLHGAAVVANWWRYGEAGWLMRDMLTLRGAGVALPADYGYGLGGVYAAWVGCVVVLYPVCQWYGRVRKQRKEWIFRML